MGHRQQMTAKERLKWDIDNYNKRKEANRGHNFQYLTDELYKDFESKGYKQCRFMNGNDTTFAESTAVGAAIEFRNKGYYARVVCTANKLRIREYAVFYKEKK